MGSIIMPDPPRTDECGMSDVAGISWCRKPDGHEGPHNCGASMMSGPCVLERGHDGPHRLTYEAIA